MALRRLLGSLALAALLAPAGMGCKGKGAGTDLDKRCQRLAATCGDNDKHVEKILEECKEAAKGQVERGCAEQASALYDCYQKELCGGGEKVWTLDDFRVLADRHGKCVAERQASLACLQKK
jgi:hypothetical protein